MRSWFLVFIKLKFGLEFAGAGIEELLGFLAVRVIGVLSFDLE
jgi:hypothetical protein